MKSSDSLTVLLIEDEMSIASNIADYMERKGHLFDFAYKGDQGLEFALDTYYDLIILDLNLPVMDGIEVCRNIRDKSPRHIPVLMLTARDTIEDKVAGFAVGADDYLTKPFSLQELEVRCQALSRRHLLHCQDTLELGPITLKRKQRLAMRDNKTLSLSSMGFKLLTVLAEAYPQIVTRSELSQKLWGDAPTESDALRSHIYQLRAALDKPFSYPVLKTVHGVGFALDLDQKPKA